MSSPIERLVNPRGLEHPVAEGVALGLGTAAMAGVVITSWLHRGNHRGVEYSEQAKSVFRKANFITTGMSFSDWVVHLTHHAFPDRYNQEAHETWNANRPDGAPEAPEEAFRDPYSVKLEGYATVKFKTPALHGRAKRKVLPWLYELAAFDEANDIDTRDHWPEYLRRFDVEEADPTKLRNKHAWAGLVFFGVGLAAARSPKTAVAWTATHVPLLLNMGGFINAEAHTGQKKGFINRTKTQLGIQEPTPNEGGELAADIMHGYEGLFFGEPRHEYHHNNPHDPFIAGDTLQRDPGGKLIKFLVKLGHAETPGAKPERNQAA